VTLSYDLTFLAMLLNALYEPGERAGLERCPTHPVKAHEYVVSPVMEYVADMNVALAYHKCMDNWMDDLDLMSAGEGRLLRQAYRRVNALRPDKCAAIENWLEQIHGMEAQRSCEIDPPVNATGQLLGELFVYPREHMWENELRSIGDGLGRFVYFMDAYDDLPGDIRHNRFNPLRKLSEREDYEALCKSAMTMMVADAADAFERLPVVTDSDIIRNVLYSGIWSKYALLQSKRNAR